MTPLATKALRVCTISDGLDSVLLVASLLSSLKDEVDRTDLQFHSAREALRLTEAGAYDLLVIAPRLDGRTPAMLTELLTIGAGPFPHVLLLLAEGQEAPADLPENVRILHGPPFPSGPLAEVIAAAEPARSPAPADAAPGESRPKIAFLRLIRRGAPAALPAEALTLGKGGSRVFVVQPVCGGAGSTTFALNLAVTLAEQMRAEKMLDGDEAPAVCLLDLNLQFGSVGTYANLPPNTRLNDAYRNIGRLDAEAFRSCLHRAAKGVAVFQTPNELLPPDALDHGNAERLIGFARMIAPVVIVDMPMMLTDWSERIFLEADRIWCMSQMEVRAARNARLLCRLLEAISLPQGRLQHVINRAPARRPSDWDALCRAFEEGTGQPISAILPDGGAQVCDASDQGIPLAMLHPKNALAAAIRAFAGQLTGARPATGAIRAGVPQARPSREER